MKAIQFPNLGIIEKQLDKKEIDYLWKCIDDKGKTYKSSLVGHIENSYELGGADYFYTNTVAPIILEYQTKFGNLGSKIPTTSGHPYVMKQWWVNYQNENEFNPIHNHNGVYSFVIWMKIPTDWNLQRDYTFNDSAVSNFEFSYTNILGEIESFTYRMSGQMEGTMVLFPSKLKHQVYPFYNCKEQRVSISGNIHLKT